MSMTTNINMDNFVTFITEWLERGSVHLQFYRIFWKWSYTFGWQKRKYSLTSATFLEQICITVQFFKLDQHDVWDSKQTY